MIAAALTLAAAVAWTPADLAPLRTDLDQLATDPAVRGAHIGIIAIDPANGVVLYDRASGDAFQPASTLKLLAGSALLEKLGPNARLHTTVTWTPPILTLHAGGDPLHDADLEAAARAVVKAGVRDVWRIDIDESRYDGERIGAGWSWDDLGEDYAARISPAILDDNAIELHVQPGKRAGDPPVLASNEADGIPIRMRAHTAAAGAVDTLDVVRDGDGLAVVGDIVAGAPPDDLDAAVPDAASFMRARFSAALRRAGANVRGPALIVRVGPAAVEPATTLWRHDSPPLATVVADCWQPSDNVVAEMMLRELAIADGTSPGSSQAGIAAERAWLTAIGLDPAGLDVVDGSGLSPYDRVTPQLLAGILVHDWNGPLREPVRGALPVAGQSGTLAHAYLDPPLVGHVFAKTGTLRHVATLAGYVEPVCKPPVAFAILVDDFPGDRSALGAWRGRVLARIAVTPCAASGKEEAAGTIAPYSSSQKETP